MTISNWLALIALLFTMTTFVAGCAWRAFHGIWKTYRGIETKLGSMDQLLWFHQQMLAWQDARIERLEKRRSA